jgi:hypothetical protein
MAEPSPILDLLACPRCDRTPLTQGAHGYRCDGCRIDFPDVNGIPFLFAEPNAALGEWRQRTHMALRRLEQDQARIATARTRQGLGALADERLARLESAYAENAAELSDLLQPLQLTPLSARLETYLALRTRLPADHGLNTYYPNIHRDWCWGEEENQASAEMLLATLPDDYDPGRVLVLGAGAGRLAYDFHMQTGAQVTLALDFNPLLLLVAQRVCTGESVELHEFPIAPRRMADEAIKRTLVAPAPVREGFHLILGDALRAPLAGGAFDTVVTPWLIDILPLDFQLLAKRINGLLTQGGRWINFGSLAFRHSDPALCYSYEEVLALVEESGFRKPQTIEATMPYMCSPASRHGRREHVMAFSARRERSVGRQARYQALPDWIVTGKDPVPLSESFQTQAMSTRIYGFVMSMIDGKRTLKDMAALMEQQKLMPVAEAEAAIRSFLIKMYDESREPPGL